MRVAIAGAGAVGRSIAISLLEAGHKVLLIERQTSNFQPELVPDADWMLADACELRALESAGVHTCDVVIAAAGDDKVNLVFSLLAKTEFAVRRVVARVNDPSNDWLFTEAWGVDVAVSTPSTLVAAVEAAVVLGDAVRLVSLRHGQRVVAITLPADGALIGRQVGDLTLPNGTALLTILRGGTVIRPRPESTFEPGDEVVLFAAADVENHIPAAFVS